MKKIEKMSLKNIVFISFIFKISAAVTPDSVLIIDGFTREGMGFAIS